MPSDQFSTRLFADTVSRSRSAFRPSFALHFPHRSNRGCGDAGRRCARGKKYAHKRHGHTGNTRNRGATAAADFAGAFRARIRPQQQTSLITDGHVRFALPDVPSRALRDIREPLIRSPHQRGRAARRTLSERLHHHIVVKSRAIMPPLLELWPSRKPELFQLPIILPLPTRH